MPITHRDNAPHIARTSATRANGPHHRPTIGAPDRRLRTVKSAMSAFVVLIACTISAHHPAAVRADSPSADQASQPVQGVPAQESVDKAGPAAQPAANHALAAIEKEMLAKWKSIDTLSAKLTIGVKTISETHKITLDIAGHYELKKRGEELLIRMDVTEKMHVVTDSGPRDVESDATTIVEGDLIHRLFTGTDGKLRAQTHKVDYDNVIKLGGPLLIDEWHHYFDLTVGSPGTFRGRATHVLSGPSKLGPGTITFHIDQEYGLLVKMEAIVIPDVNIRRMEVTNIRINPKLASDRFVLDVPEGVELQQYVYDDEHPAPGSDARPAPQVRPGIKPSR